MEAHGLQAQSPPKVPVIIGFPAITHPLDPVGRMSHNPAAMEAVFFDAAGTLIDVAEPVGGTYARILAEHGIRRSPGELQSSFGVAFKEAGVPDYGEHLDGNLAEREWWQRVVSLTLGEDASDEAFGALFKHYAHGEAWVLRDEVLEALEFAKGKGLRLAVVSNFDLRLHRILRELGINDYFEHTVTSAEAHARKPDPAIFKHAMESMGLESSQILHIGDNPHADGDGAASVGIQCRLICDYGESLLKCLV